jgi:MarR family transcriptional regulator, transcriptional regulator for hemolysin
MDWNPSRMPALQITRAARLLTRLSDARFKELGIGPGQFATLMTLKERGRLTQKELAQIVGVAQPSMAELLGRMERDGLIERTPDERDGRSTIVSLTAASQKKIEPVRDILAKGNAEALAGFEPVEVEALYGLLDRVIANLS